MFPFGSADNNSLRTTSSISRCTSSLNNQRTQQPQFPQQVSTPNFYSPSVDIHISAQHFAPVFHASNSCNTRNTKPTPEFGAMDRLAAFNQQFTVSKSRQQQEAPTHVNSSYDDSLSSISDCTSTSSTSSPSSTSFTSSTSSSSSPFSSSYSFSPSSPFSPIPPWLQGPRNDYPQQQQQQVQNQQQPCEEWKPTPLFRTSSAPDLMYGGNPFSRNTTPCPSLSRATVSQSLSYSGGLSSMSGTQHPLAMSTTPPSSPSPAGTAPSTPLIMSPVSPSNMSPGTPIVPPCNRSGTPPLPVDECPVSPQPPALSPSPPVRDSSNATPTYTLGGSTASLSSASFHRPSPEMTPSGFFATLSLNTPTVNTSQETGGSEFVSSLSSVKGRLFCDEGDYSTSPLPSARKSGKIRRLKSKSSDGTSTPFRSSSMNRIPMVTPPTPPLAANPRSIEPIPFGIAPRRPASTPPADEDTCSMSRERREPPSPYKPSPKLRSSEPISHWEKHKLPRCSSYDSLLLEAHEPPLQAIPCPLFSSNNTSSSIQGIPTFRGKGTTNNCISPETLRDLIKGLFGAHVHKVVIFDCRFPYEYAGGHITNAINLTGSGVEEVLKTYFTEEKLAEADQTAIVFHCEFSQQRGPAAKKIFCQLDCTYNQARYPLLSYNKCFLLEGGYREFFQLFPKLCDGNYVKMTDDTEGLRGCIRGKRADAIRRTVSLQQLRNPRVALQIPPHSHTPDPIPQSQPFVEPDNLPSTGPSNQTQIFPQEFQAVPQNSGNHAIPKALQFQEPNQVPMGPPPAPCSIPTHNNTQQQKPAVIVPPQPNPDVFQFGANQPSPPTLTSSSSWNQQTLHRSQSTFS